MVGDDTIAVGPPSRTLRRASRTARAENLLHRAESERGAFIRQEWPAIRERMKRLGIEVDDLLKAERA